MAEPLKIFSLLDFYNIKSKNRIQLGTEYPSLNSCNEGDLYIWHKPLSDEPVQPEEPTQPVDPYNQALALVGVNSVNSLEAVLINSDYCTALASNTEAYGIMKANYSANMTNAIDSNWNEGLNLLNFKCTLPCYLYKTGNMCNNITGGFEKISGKSTFSATTSYMQLSHTGGDAIVSGHVMTVNNIDYSGYTNAIFDCYKSGSANYCRAIFGNSSRTDTAGNYKDVGTNIYTDTIEGGYFGMFIQTNAGNTSTITLRINSIKITP